MLTLRTVGAAVIGALIALLIVMGQSFGAMLIVIGGVVVGTTLATRVLTSIDPSIPDMPGGNERKPSPLSRNPARPLPVAPPPAERVTTVLPVRPDVEWWSKTSVAGARRDRSRAVSAPPLDLSGYVESARVVQCPNCASFRINVRHLDVGYSFSCHRCGHPWDWQANTPWPKTIKVSKRLRADPLSRHQTDRQTPNTSRRH